MFLDQLSGSCGTPRYLSNGQRRYSGTTVESRVIYTCNTGYRMTAGSSRRTCQSNGLWSGIHPTCTRKSTLCHYISFAYWLQYTCRRIASIFSMHNNPFHFQNLTFPLLKFMSIILCMLFISCCSHILKHYLITLSGTVHDMKNFFWGILWLFRADTRG